MQELVTAFAKASKAILQAEEQGTKKSKSGGSGNNVGNVGMSMGGGGGGGRKSAGKKTRRGRSETMGLWFVKA